MLTFKVNAVNILDRKNFNSLRKTNKNLSKITYYNYKKLDYFTNSSSNKNLKNLN